MTRFDESIPTPFQELLQHWGLAEPVVVGQYTPVGDKPFGFFNNIKDKRGNKLSYPGQINEDVSAYVHRNDLETGTYYQFTICLASENERTKKNNPYLIKTDLDKEIITAYNPRKWIEQLCEDTGKTHRDASNLSNALDKIAGDLYTEAERFIFELLQNADDFPNESLQVAIQFILLEEHLLILHNGRPFSQREVEAISSIGDSTKAGDSSKTGYKGIGFKSVFTDADCVYIYSGDYRFRYDKTYYNNPESTPWQLKPIWTDVDDLPVDIRNCCDFFRSPVAISLRVGKTKITEYRNRFKELFSEPRFMLFLRHINFIQVSGLSQGLTIKLNLNKNNNISQILYNGKLKSEWLVKSFELEIPNEIRKEIESDAKVPKKLQEATRTQLIFAAKLEQGKIVKLSPEESILFTYLPTSAKDFDFPFVINADFLTTTNREDLRRDSHWNSFLFTQIGYHLGKFLAWISTDEPNYQNYITMLIKQEFRSTEALEIAFNEGLEKGLEEIAFIPSLETTKLLKLSQAIFDETKITTIISPEIIKPILDIPLEFISNDLDKPEKLKIIGIEVFGIDELISCLKEPTFLFPKNYLKIITHLYKETDYQKIKAEELPIFYNEKEVLVASTPDNPVYFHPPQLEKDLLNFAKFNFLHPELVKGCQSQPELKECFTALGVKEFVTLQIIRQRIITGKYETEEKSYQNYLNHVKLIFKYRNSLTNAEYNKLSENLELIAELIDNLDTKYSVKANKCYLSNYYQPHSFLEDIPEEIKLGELYFISADYCQKQEEIKEWREFFLRLKVGQLNGCHILKIGVLPLLNNNQINKLNTVAITRFIFKVFLKESINEELKKGLKELPLLTTNGELHRAKNCYLSPFYSSTAKYPKFLENIDIPKVISRDYYTPYQFLEEYRQFFLSIGVTELDESELIKQKISLVCQDSDLVTTQNTVSITREIFEQRDKLTQPDFEKLRELRLLLKNGQLAVAEDCYFANEYNPRQDLETLFSLSINKAKIISPSYLSLGMDKEWKEFLQKIGVSEEIKISTLSKLANQSYREEYLKECGWVNVNSTLTNSIGIDSLLENLGNYKFLTELWNYLIENWERLNLGEKLKRITIISNKPSFLGFICNQYPAIPCNDGQCHKSGDIYSHRLKSHLDGCDLPVSSIKFTQKIEDFLGIKTCLDIPACLRLLDQVTQEKVVEKRVKQVDFIYNQLSACLPNYSQPQGYMLMVRTHITNWKPQSKLLACDDSFYPPTQLYYLSKEVNLPYKRNPNLIYIPEELNNQKQFEHFLLETLQIRTINPNNIQVVKDSQKQCHILHNLILERVSYLSIYLSNSDNLELFSQLESKIRNALEYLQIYTCEKLYYYFKEIDYREDIYNFYEQIPNQIIYYVGNWNNRRNAKIGEYLIQAFSLDKYKITAEKLLDFLEDSIETIRKDLENSGFNLTNITKNYSSSSIQTLPDGTGNNAEEWGNWGERIARRWYESQGYQVTKQKDNIGYDFLCKKGQDEIYAEIKTISDSISDSKTIRITANEWRVMCTPMNQTNYELLIIVHRGESVVKSFQIKSVWLTLQEIISKLNGYELVDSPYNSQQVDVLLGLQRSSNNNSNVIIFDYLKICEYGLKLTDKINTISITSE